MPFIVRNTTDRTLMLADIRVEIGPRKILDLERVIQRVDIEGSRSLQSALAIKRLQLVKKTVVHNYGPPTKIIERERTIEKGMDEDRLKSLIKEVISEELSGIKRERSHDTEVGDAVKKSIQPLIDSLRDRINSVGPAGQSGPKQNVEIDPKRLAEIQQEAVKKISENIHDGQIKTGKRIKLINSRAKDLADEL